MVLWKKHRFMEPQELGWYSGSATYLRCDLVKLMRLVNDTWTPMKSNGSWVKENWWQGKVLYSTSHSGAQADRGADILNMWLSRSPCTLASSHHTREEKIWNIMCGQFPQPNLKITSITSTAFHWPGLCHMVTSTCQRDWEMTSSCEHRRFG